ncbi:MAG TPA: DUF3048 domain-containing protein, partial [Anaerolineales bacterium]|nr:DUF3048 domain-containing protein [Anaerolineales bacterium]
MSCNPEPSRARLAMLARGLCAGFLLAACGGEAEQPTPAVVQLPAQTAVAPAAHVAAPSATASVVAVQPGVTPPPAPAVTVFVPEPTITQPPEATRAAEALVGPHSYPPGVNPLSGLPVADAAVLQRRPLAIKVSNFPRSVRPQSGLATADMVWEHYAEGGTTRFTAVFYSRDAGRVGSIRSARLIDTTLTEAFAGALVASGMSDGTLERLRQK